MRFITLSEYDAVLLAALRKHGLSDDDARNLIAARWPMDAPGLLCEANGRGLLLDMADVGAFVAEFVGPPANEENTLFTPVIAEQVFSWCVETDRARLTANGQRLQQDNTDRVLKNICRRAAAPMN